MLMQRLQAVAEQSQGGLAGGAALAEAQLRGQGSVGAKTGLVLILTSAFPGPPSLCYRQEGALRARP